MLSQSTIIGDHLSSSLYARSQTKKEVPCHEATNPLFFGQLSASVSSLGFRLGSEVCSTTTVFHQQYLLQMNFIFLARTFQLYETSFRYYRQTSVAHTNAIKWKAWYVKGRALAITKPIVYKFGLASRLRYALLEKRTSTPAVV